MRRNNPIARKLYRRDVRGDAITYSTGAGSDGASATVSGGGAETSAFVVPSTCSGSGAGAVSSGIGFGFGASAVAMIVGVAGTVSTTVVCDALCTEGVPNSWTTKIVSCPSYIPTALAMPISVYFASRIFSRCDGEFIQAFSTSEESEKSTAKFSPACVNEYPAFLNQYHGSTPSGETCAK